MQKKKREPRRSYLNDFKLNAAGRYEYFGRHFVWDNPNKDRKRAFMLAWALTVTLIGLTLASGCDPAAGMSNTFYVILPYIAEFAALFSVVWGACRLTFGGERLREYVYRETVPKLPRRTLLVAVSAGVGLVGSAVFIILNGFEGRVLLSLTYPIAKAAEIAVALWLRQVWGEFRYACD